MPFFVLLLIALAAGLLIVYASLRYPTPVVTSPAGQAQTTAEHVVERPSRGGNLVGSSACLRRHGSRLRRAAGIPAAARTF